MRSVRLKSQELTQLFTRIYKQELSYVYASVGRLGVPVAQREDVTHDVFVIVHRKLADYDPLRPLRPWLFGIAYRVVLDHKRKASNAREIPSLKAHEERAGEADTPGEREEARAARDLIMEALEAVPIERRVVFILHKLDRCDVADIAREFALPIHTVYARLRRANEEFAHAVRALQNSKEEG